MSMFHVKQLSEEERFNDSGILDLMCQLDKKERDEETKVMKEKFSTDSRQQKRAKEKQWKKQHTK